MYRDAEGATKPIQYLGRICSSIPVYIGFGGNADVMCVFAGDIRRLLTVIVIRPRYVQDNLVYHSDRLFASVTWIGGAGHLVSGCLF